MAQNLTQVRPCNGEGEMPQLAPKRIDAGELLIAEEVPTGGGASGQSSPEDFEAIKKRMARASIRQWTRIVSDSLKAAEKKRILVVDDSSDLTPTTAKLLSTLAKECTIFTALHEVKKGQEKYFWKFDRLPIVNLPKEDARKLIHAAAAGADIEDMQLFETRILQESASNPRAILESVDRLRKEPSITRNAVRELSHTGARPKLDLTWGILLVVVPLIAARFVARGMGDTELYVLAGVGSALAIAARFFLYRLRR